MLTYSVRYLRDTAAIKCALCYRFLNNCKNEKIRENEIINGTVAIPHVFQVITETRVKNVELL